MITDVDFNRNISFMDKCLELSPGPNEAGRLDLIPSWIIPLKISAASLG